MIYQWIEHTFKIISNTLNKFYDYFYARLPIICNNTHAFSDFINENKIGFTINNIREITVRNLRRKHYFC